MWAEIIALPFVVLIILANCSFYHSTPWVAWVFLIMAAVDIVFDIKNVRIASRDINELPCWHFGRNCSGRSAGGAFRR